MSSAMFDRIKSEPAIVAGIVQAILGLLLAFGVDLSTEQVGAIMAATAAGLALFVRSQVVPLMPMRHIGSKSDEAGAIDVGTAIVIFALLLVLLVLLGVIPAGR